jgi:hypothetical protein
MERTFQHEIVYDFDDQATVEEIAASLVANARFVRDAVAVIKACHPGLEISNLRVRLASVTQESPLKELLTVALVMAFQKDLEEEVPDLINALTGIDIPDRFDSLVTIFVVGVSLYGALKLVDRVVKDRQAQKLEAAYGSVTNVAGDLINVSPEVVRDQIDRYLGGSRSRSVAKSARDFFRPAKKYHARSIETNSPLSIGKEAIDEVPSEVDESAFEPRIDEHDVTHVVINLRAHDLDKDKSGWAAVIDDISPNRVKLHRDPSIPAEVLFTKPSIRGDVRVHSQENEDGEMEPILYVLLRISDDEPTKSAQGQ